MTMNVLFSVKEGLLLHFHVTNHPIPKSVKMLIIMLLNIKKEEMLRDGFIP